MRVWQVTAIGMLSATLAWGGEGPAGGMRVVMNFTNVEFRVLAEAVSEYTGREIVVAPDVKGRVNLKSAQPMGPEELHNAFVAVAEVLGLRVVEEEKRTTVTLVPPEIRVAPSPGRIDPR